MVKWNLAKVYASDEHIKQIEQAVGHKFPIDYVEWIKQHHGTYPELFSAYFYLDGEEFDICFMYSLLPPKNEEEESNYLLRNYHVLVNDVGFPNELVPFGEDSAGKWYCFDYRNESVSIVYVNWEYSYENEKEKAIKFVCKSFTEFLENLVEEPIED